MDDRCPDLSELLPVGYGLLPPCSGNGVCVNGTCVCKPGWTGRSDLFNMEGLDCQINTQIVYYLWLVCLVLSAGLWLSTIPRVLDRIKTYRRFKLRRLDSGKSFHWWTNPSLLSIFFFEVICIPPSTAYGILKLVSSEERLGVTLASTVCFVVAHTGFFISIFCFQPFLLSTLLKASRSLQVLVPINFSFAIYMTLSTIFIASAPLILYAITGGELGVTTRAVCIAYFAIFGLTLYTFVIQAAYILHKVNKLLRVDMGEATPHIERVRKAIAVFQVQGIIQGLVLGTVYLLFASWPFLWTKHDYWLPFVWVAGTMVWRYLAFTAVSNAATSLQAASGDDIDRFYFSSLPGPQSTFVFGNSMELSSVSHMDKASEFSL